MTSLTRTNLVNLALREIGTDRITDWNEDSPEADVAKDVWDQARRMTLSRHEWRFAIVGRELAKAATAPVTRFDYCYTLPGGFVRLGVVSQYSTMEPQLIDWKMTADGIATSAGSLFIEYVYDAPAIGAWPPWFCDVFVVDLASLMASPLKSTTERERLEQLANKRLSTGRSIDSQQNAPGQWRGGAWIAAHRGARAR